MGYFIYDIECFFNYFMVGFIVIDPKLKKKEDIEVDTVVETKFRIGNGHNDVRNLEVFLQTCVKGLCGFNNKNYDSVLIGYILEHASELAHKTPEAAARFIYVTSQEIINDKYVGKKYVPEYKELDLYLMWHFDNVARATSLKWIECHLGMKNIQDIPFNHDEIITPSMAETIDDYNLNDNVATYKLFILPQSQEMITVRRSVEKQYEDSFMNLSNASMGEKMVLLECKPYIKPDLRPTQFFLKDIMFDIINFKTPAFQKVHQTFAKYKVHTGGFNQCDVSCIVDGLSFDFGLGGLHAARPRSYNEDIDSVDVISFYPNVAINNALRPIHLGHRFVQVYYDMYKRRRTFAKKTPGNMMLKESLVSVFGKSNSQYSDLYDPKFTYGITINGQLLMAMLCERLMLAEAARIIMVNTDGIEIKVLDRAKCDDIIRRWEKMTGFETEKVNYEKLLIRDVNNYTAGYRNATGGLNLKSTGDYVVDKDLHKDPSGKVITMAVREWFCYGIDVEHFIRAQTDLSLFAMFVRAKGGEFVVTSGIHTQKLPRTLRYVIVKRGGMLFRKFGRKKTKVHTKNYVAILNKWPDKLNPEIEIDYNYYIQKAKELIRFAKDEEPGLFSDIRV